MKRKKISKFIIILTGIITLLFNTYMMSYAVTSSDYIYRIIDNQIEITKYIGPMLSKYPTDVKGTVLVIPEEIDGLPVTSIGDGAFAPSVIAATPDRLYVEKVVLPETITNIGSTAFSYTRIDYIKLPSSLLYIGDFAFSSSHLSSIEIPDSVTFIGKGCFMNSGLKTVVLPDNLDYIPDNMFADCGGLVDIKLPLNLISIGKGAFADCYDLTEMELPETLYSIGEIAFRSCSLVKLTIPENVEEIGDSAFIDNDPNLIVTCTKDSYAEGYLLSSGLSFNTIPSLQLESTPEPIVSEEPTKLPDTSTEPTQSTTGNLPNVDSGVLPLNDAPENPSESVFAVQNGWESLDIKTVLCIVFGIVCVVLVVKLAKSKRKNKT